VIARLIV